MGSREFRSEDGMDTLRIEMIKDPEFQKEVAMVNPANAHYVGDDLVRGYPKGVTGPPNVVKFVKDYLTKEYGYKFD